MWIKRFFSHRYRIILSLFLISTIHMIAFGMAQNPVGVFITTISHRLRLVLMLFLYGSAILMALCNQIFTRKFGVKKVLLGGLVFYFFGLVFFFVSQFSRGSFLFDDAFLSLGMVFSGIGFSAVFISLVTFLILEIPHFLGVAITALFAFVNIGVMLSPLLMNYFASWEEKMFFLFIVELLILFSISFIGEYFVDPPFPQHLAHLRKPMLIWRELHYRFFLFILLVGFYSVCENTLNLWGGKFLGFFFAPNEVQGMVAVFWLFLIFGQFLMLIPLYFFAARGIFFLLVFLIILVLISFPAQTELMGFISRLAIGGIACSACSPILLAMLEEELKEVQESSHFHLRILPYLEMGIAWVIVGYFAIAGVIAFAVDTINASSKEIVQHQFVIAIICATLMLLITIFLSISLHRRRKKKKLLNLDEI